MEAIIEGINVGSITRGRDYKDFLGIGTSVYGMKNAKEQRAKRGQLKRRSDIDELLEMLPTSRAPRDVAKERRERKKPPRKPKPTRLSGAALQAKFKKLMDEGRVEEARLLVKENPRKSK